MYRVMLIDDEPAARNLLRVAVDWTELDMEVVGEAASGIEAINVIDDLRPDLAFVDISMPFMDGLKFTELATERYPDLVIIIMTAFDDFEYARKAVRLPVMEYMVKPAVREDVREVLQRARAQLDKCAAQRALQPAPADPEEDFSATEQIMRYLKENYTDSTLNLTKAAQQFGFSTSYLSRKFKQETGMNFVECLTNLRMNKARELACEGMKMFKTAEKVGIPDPNYFGRSFKKYTGMSYSDYVAQYAKS